MKEFSYRNCNSIVMEHGKEFGPSVSNLLEPSHGTHLVWAMEKAQICKPPKQGFSHRLVLFFLFIFHHPHHHHVFFKYQQPRTDQYYSLLNALNLTAIPFELDTHRFAHCRFHLRLRRPAFWLNILTYMYIHDPKSNLPGPSTTPHPSPAAAYPGRCGFGVFELDCFYSRAVSSTCTRTRTCASPQPTS